MGTHTCPSCRCDPVVIPADTPANADARRRLYRYFAVLDAGGSQEKAARELRLLSEVPA